MKVLVIEDSLHLQRSLVVGLNNLGFPVEATGDGYEGLNLALYNHYDIIILDLNLPNIDGITLLKTIRQQGIDSKVIIISARVTVDDRIKGLLSGADDYLTKPFSIKELHARMIAIQKRSETLHSSNIIKYGDFILNSLQKSFTYKNTAIELTKSEFKIIETIFNSENAIVSADKINKSVQKGLDRLSKNTIEAHISSVRKKTKKIGGILPIKNKRGFGYLMEISNEIK